MNNLQMPHWRVRPASTRDLAALVENNLAMAWETEHRRLDRTRVEPGTRCVIDDPARGFYIVAEHEEVIAGQLLVTFEWSDWRNGVFWWIQSVYVSPEFRRQGVFRALLAHLNELAREDGNVCGFRLYMERDNRVARAVYRSLGFTETSYEMLEKDFILGSGPLAEHDQ